MDTVKFRQATEADIQAIASLHTVSWRDVYRGILPDEYLDGPIVEERIGLWRSRFSSQGAERQYVLLAEFHGGLIGFTCVLLDEEPQWGACLDNLHVLPGWRGGGLGRQLFSEATEWVMAKEPEWSIHLWVFEANNGARRLYDALGGDIAQLQTKKVVEEIRVPSLRYVWHDLQKLLNNLSGVS